MEQKHSGLGIASFVISIVMGIAAFVLVAIAGVIEVTTPGGIDSESADAVVLGLFIIACLFLNLVATGLGIAGMFQKDRKKLFAVLGTIFSIVTVTGIIFLMIIGNMAE